MKSSSSSKPHVIVMVGIPGSGKTYFAEHFADTFKAPLVSIDKIRQSLYDTGIDNHPDEQFFGGIANCILDEVIKTGRTVVYDGQTDLRIERSIIAKKLKDAGYEPLIVWVQTEPTTAKKRALRFVNNKQNITSEQFENKLKKFSPPHQVEHAIVISGKHTYSSQLKIVLKHLVFPRNTTPENNNQTAARNVQYRNTLIR